MTGAVPPCLEAAVTAASVRATQSLARLTRNPDRGAQIDRDSFG